MSVQIANINGGEVRAEFLLSLLRLLDADTRGGRRVGGFLMRTGGPMVAMLRDACVRDFLETGSEWIWFVDSDIRFPAETLDRLFDVADAVRCPIVGGEVPVHIEGRVHPTLLYWRNSPPDQAGPSSMPSALEPRLPPPDANCVEVDATGAACLLVHRDVFIRMREAAPDSVLPWFAETTEDGRFAGEDVTFCTRARALGYRIVVRCHLGIDHLKTFALSAGMYDRRLATADGPATGATT